MGYRVWDQAVRMEIEEMKLEPRQKIDMLVFLGCLPGLRKAW